MNIPTIGGARGIFEIFVPGTFLLLNLGFFIYISPFTDPQLKHLITSAATSPAIALILVITFGYLIGILLRLVKTDITDHLSGFLLRLTARREHPSETRLWATEEFPYIGWLGKSCHLYLSKDVEVFYSRIWSPQKRKGQNKQFFNFVKTMLCSKDERADTEVYAAESLSRYISGMFYALSFAFILFVFTIFSTYFASGQWSIGLILVAIAYLVAMIIILSRFRFIRIKEVEAVFAASYKNKEMFKSMAVGEELFTAMANARPHPAGEAVDGGES